MVADGHEPCALMVHSAEGQDLVQIPLDDTIGIDVSKHIEARNTGLEQVQVLESV